MSLVLDHVSETCLSPPTALNDGAAIGNGTVTAGEPPTTGGTKSGGGGGV